MSSDGIKSKAGTEDFMRGFLEEEGDRTLIAIYKFDESITEYQLEDIAQVMVVEFDSRDIAISDENYIQKLDSGSYIMFNLNKTNINSEYLVDLQEVGIEMNGYIDFIISTVGVEDIPRLS